MKRNEGVVHALLENLENITLGKTPVTGTTHMCDSIKMTFQNRQIYGTKSTLVAVFYDFIIKRLLRSHGKDMS